MSKEVTGYYEDKYPRDVEEIIFDVPSWILRWGITIFLAILIMLLGMSFIIKYPETVKAQIMINLSDAPKSIITKVSGKIDKIFVSDGDFVRAGTVLALLESTGDYGEVKALISSLEDARDKQATGGTIGDAFFKQSMYSNLGELQEYYQIFYQALLKYRMAGNEGAYVRRRRYLLTDLKNIERKKLALSEQIKLQERDIELAQEELKMHESLINSKFESRAEFREHESKYLLKKISFIQLNAEMHDIANNSVAKKQELSELDSEIIEVKQIFFQSLNSLLSRCYEWKRKFVMTAPQDGKVSFNGSIQANRAISAGDNLFSVTHGSRDFFGELHFTQTAMGKIKVGQPVLAKLESFPYEEFGILRGKVVYIAELPQKDDEFISRVIFELDSRTKKTIYPFLKSGMIGDAEIITENSSVFRRITRSIMKY